MTAEHAFALLGAPDHWTLSRALRRQAARRGEDTFATFGDGTALSFAGFDREADRLAGALGAAGIARGDRVFAMLRNRAEFLLLAVACGRAGAIFVPVNTELKGYSLQHQLHNAMPRMVFVEADLVGAFDAVPADAGPSMVIVLGGDVSAALPRVLSGASAWTYADLLARGHDGVPAVEPAAHEVGCIMYTSGTTGPAKGVLMPHAHLALFSVPSAALQLDERDVYYVCMPLFHANALFVQVFASLLCGARVHCVERFSTRRWLSDVRACGATITNSLGAMTELLFRMPAAADDADNPLRRVLAVPVADWIGEFERRFGVRVFQGFGMTECNMLAYGTADDPCTPGCAGTVRSRLFDVRIVDPDTDRPLPDGEIGEIVVRPKVANAFMQGYFDMPEKTVEAWRNLWFHTGDAGRLDHGRLHFADRIRDRIRRRGENVSAFEVEQALMRLAGVQECAVVGVVVGDAGSEQEIKACIVRRPDAPLDAVQVLQHCIAHVPRFAVPHCSEVGDALPKTPSNKVQRHLLRATGVQAAWDREAEGHSARRARTAPAAEAGS